MKLTVAEFAYLGRCVECFLFGFYSGIFAIHWEYYTSKEETGGVSNFKRNITFYALCVLYMLSAGVIALDIAVFVTDAWTDDVITAYRIGGVSQPVLFSSCDFITQCILIHRCWIVWGRNIRVVTIPSILAFTYLVMSIVAVGALFIVPGVGIDETLWGNDLFITSLAASMTVNALATGLIAFKIFKVFREVKNSITSNEKSLGMTRGRNLRSVIFIIIESGMVLFAIQLARLAITIPPTPTDTVNDVFNIVVAIHVMVNGITPTIILVRVSMGLSFHDEPSLVETVGSLRFVAYDSNEMKSLSQDSVQIGSDDPIPIAEIGEVRRGDGTGESDEIRMVDR